MAAGSNYVIDKVKNTNAYKNLVNELASNAKGSGSETFAYDGSISFEKNDDNDLFGGIHAANAKIYGQLNNGQWEIAVSIEDTYDFHKLKGSGAVTTANNAAERDQVKGIINNYNVHITFSDKEDY